MKIEFILFFLLINISLIAKNNSTAVDEKNNNAQDIADQTNLVLRQVGHQLLLNMGNDSTAILPVQQVAAHSFLLTINQSFNYDTLAFFIHDALAGFNMEEERYYVAVKDCQQETLILGYHSKHFFEGKIPCIGREQYSNCNQIYLTFPERKTILLSNHSWFYWILLASFIGWSIYFWKKKSNRKATLNDSLKNNSIPLSVTSQFISIGQSQFDLANQQLYVNDIKKDLTFREAKLLNYFISHENKLLSREAILEKVWEDEGILVGRSLDVFVSRLRKILKDDNSLKIKTVHGIGYRLEVTN